MVPSEICCDIYGTPNQAVLNADFLQMKFNNFRVLKSLQLSEQFYLVITRMTQKKHLHELIIEDNIPPTKQNQQKYLLPVDEYGKYVPTSDSRDHNALLYYVNFDSNLFLQNRQEKREFFI